MIWLTSPGIQRGHERPRKPNGVAPFAKAEAPGVSLCLSGPRRYREWVSIIKINAITVPADSGDELARRFAARAGAVDAQAGFEGFELLKPTDDRTTWLVVTRWKDEESFQAWVNSPAFTHGHRSAAERAGGETPKPVGVHSELWSYEIAGGSAG